MLHAALFEILEDPWHLISVFSREFGVHEASATVKKVVVCFHVESVSRYESVALLELILDHEAHVRERERYVVVKKKPVVVLVVEPIAFTDAKDA